MTELAATFAQTLTVGLFDTLPTLLQYEIVKGSETAINLTPDQPSSKMRSNDMLLVFGCLQIIVGIVWAKHTAELINGYLVTKDDRETLISVEKTENSTDLLDLRSTAFGIKRINRRAFNGLSNVKTLLLDGNHLASLPEFVFLGLPNLEHLSLRQNYLGTNESEGHYLNNVFLNLRELKTLDISNNRELLLKKYSFEGLDTSVNITADLKLNVSDPILFEKRPEPLIVLCFNGSIVKSAEIIENIKKPQITLENCPKIIRVTLWSDVLHLQKLGITGFEKDWYKLQSAAVHHLVLTGNEISRVTSTILNRLPKDLTHVYLNENPIDRLETGMIDNMNLVYMDFSHCGLTGMETDALVHTSLKSLKLVWNSLGNSSFALNLPNTLEELNLNSGGCNHLIPNGFSKLNKLKRLALNNNFISSLEKGAFNGLDSINILNLAGNMLTEITNDAFYGLSKYLKTLNLYGNAIKVLRKGAFVNTVINELNLSNMRIKKIESGSFDLPKLSWLRLQSNSLRIVEKDTFLGLPNVVYVDMTDSYIETIEKGARNNLNQNAFIALDRNTKINDEDAAIYNKWNDIL